MFKIPLVIFAITIANSGYAQEVKEPRINFNGGNHELVLNTAMSTALNTYDPYFKPRSSSDYTQKILSDYGESKTNSAPFAFIDDINLDGQLDVIVDGLGRLVPEIVCILSKKNKYEVIKVHDWYVNHDPKTIVNFNDGKKEIGLNYYIWRNTRKEKSPNRVFMLGFPQETDSHGELLKDGGMIDYLFIEGKFEQYLPEF